MVLAIDCLRSIMRCFRFHCKFYSSLRVCGFFFSFSCRFCFGYFRNSSIFSFNHMIRWLCFVHCVFLFYLNSYRDVCLYKYLVVCFCGEFNSKRLLICLEVNFPFMLGFSFQFEMRISRGYTWDCPQNLFGW